MIAIGWLITIASLWLLFLWVPFEEVIKATASSHIGWLAVATAPVLANIFLRGVRWVELLKTSRSVALLRTTAICAAGLGLNATIPGKVGEIARIGLAVRALEVRVGQATVAAFIERSLDLGVLATGGLVCTYLSAGIESSSYGAQINALLISMALLTGAACIFLAFLSHEGLGKATFRRTYSLIPPGIWRRRFRRIAFDIFRGARHVSSRGTLTLIIFITALTWATLGLSVHLVSLAMPGIDSSLQASMVFAFITTLASALPSAPGAWGIYEGAGVIVGATLMTSESATALAAFVIVTHAVQYVPVVIIGISSWTWLNHRHA